MLAVLRLGREAYAVPARGLVSARIGEATAERAGRAKGYFNLTAAGVRHVREAPCALEALRVDLPRTSGAKP